MSREYNPPSWHTMEGCFVGWLDDWLKCWMRQRRKSTTRYSLENFCCISLKIFGEPDTPIRIYAHPTNLCETKWEMSGKSDEGQKNMRILIVSGFAVFEEKTEKNWLSTHVIVAASQMGTLTSCWEIIEITCFRPRCGTILWGDRCRKFGRN